MDKEGLGHEKCRLKGQEGQIAIQAQGKEYESNQRLFSKRNSETKMIFIVIMFLFKWKIRFSNFQTLF